MMFPLSNRASELSILGIFTEASRPVIVASEPPASRSLMRAAIAQDSENGWTSILIAEKTYVPTAGNELQRAD